MALRSRTALRLSLAVLLAAVIPLGSAIYVTLEQASRLPATFYNPVVGESLAKSLEVYQDLAQAKKGAMRCEADLLASHSPLRSAVDQGQPESIDRQLGEMIAAHPNLLLVGIEDEEGQLLATKQRAAPFDEQREYTFEQRRELHTRPQRSLVAKFVTPRARFDEQRELEATIGLYRSVEEGLQQWTVAYKITAALLLVATMLAAIGVGIFLARSVTRRLAALAKATQALGAGDLTVRVPEAGNDEITDLARHFNGMVSEVERSRARIEFLQRMGTWQEMARRLAHEIKNPLTPIQLAVEECHWRYAGDDEAYRRLLDTTLGVVKEEIGTLRRLVTEFSSFARLPKAELAEADLAAFLRSQQQHMELFSDDDLGFRASEVEALEKAVVLSWNIPPGPLPACMDRQMLHRVLVNVVRNAAQAIAEQGTTERGRVCIGLEEVDRDWLAVHVDDDGPGIPESVRHSVFDPYVTTKKQGTGLGLSIVKKIVMEHGGSVEAGASEWGGTRVSIRIPRAGSAASLAALSGAATAPPGARNPMLAGNQPHPAP